MEQVTGRRWGARTAGERQAARRATLVRTAISLFGTAGFRNTSVKAVCVASGLTERYFYESFGNREELLHACFKQVNRRLLARMREAASAEPGPPLDRVRAGVFVYLSELEANPQAARVFLIEMASLSPDADRLVAESLDEFGALLMDTLFGEDGWRTTYNALLLRGVAGGGLHIARAWIASGHREPLDEVAGAALSLYAVMTAQNPGGLPPALGRAQQPISAASA